MKTLLLLVSFVFALSIHAQEVSTVEITPGRTPSSQNEIFDDETSSRSSSNSNSGSTFTSTFKDEYYRSQYNSNWEMREHRKLGAGIGLAGVFGTIGGVADINFDAQNAAQVGFGNGSGFNTFFMGWKTSFESQFLSPYVSLGYARWYNSDATDLRGNSYILDQVVTHSELSQGKIGVDFLTANVGAQYNQLDSEWIGNTFFLEFNFLYSTTRTRLIPAASVGTIYYF